MRKQILLTLLVGLFSTGLFAENMCFNTLIQIEENDSSLSENELREVSFALEALGDAEISAIYIADSIKGKQVASIFASAYNCPVVVDQRIEKIIPKTLFKRMGGIREFGAELIENHAGENLIIIADTSFVSFIGKYTKGGFSPIGNYECIQIDFDGEAPFLHE